jgi:hypothetical protein
MRIRLSALKIRVTLVQSEMAGSVSQPAAYFDRLFAYALAVKWYWRQSTVKLFLVKFRRYVPKQMFSLSPEIKNLLQQIQNEWSPNGKIHFTHIHQLDVL